MQRVKYEANARMVCVPRGLLTVVVGRLCKSAYGTRCPTEGTMFAGLARRCPPSAESRTMQIRRRRWD